MAGVLAVAQSGGPSAVINASLAGLVLEGRGHFKAIYGLVHGIEGALQETMIDLSAETDVALRAVASTPAAALGSSRYKLQDGDYERILDVFKAHDVRYFAYIGGNGSMYVCNRLGEMARAAGYELAVIGVPKTVDNDLWGTDHAPGYGSAAKFTALAVRDTGRDLEAMATFDNVIIYEAMGRDSGWLAAASALGKAGEDDAPHLIYVPEIPFDEEQFLSDVRAVHGRVGRCYVVVGEGIRDRDGQFIAHKGEPSSAQDMIGRPVHGLLHSAGMNLARLVSARLGLQVRTIRPGIVGRALTSCVSARDRFEAQLVGAHAAFLLSRGHSGKMVTLTSPPPTPPEAIGMGVIPLSEVIGKQKSLPPEYFAGTMITPAFRNYALPLIDGEFPPLARLTGKRVDKKAAP